MNRLKTRTSLILIFLVLFLCSCTTRQTNGQEFPANEITPAGEQIAYQEMEMIGFIHFGINTFTDREWGTGSEDPSMFNPEELDAGQWVETARSAGMGMLILTAKHHDGFCLWPSRYTDHTVENSPWRNGGGDVVKELSEACREAGLKFGIYLSPWDMHEESYGTDAYNEFYKDQLRELLTNYGTISEVWMDGAKGENARDMEYDFEGYREIIYELQPRALIFSDVGPDVRWIGNEHGIAGRTNWSTLTTAGLEIGDANTYYLNTGDPYGKKWIVGECDVSIRPGWFYHADQDDRVKSPGHLVDLYYRSVGRNGTFLLNLPPDKRGLIHENDREALREFREILGETFRHDLSDEGRAEASSVWDDSGDFDPSLILDEDMHSFWAASAEDTLPAITLYFDGQVEFDRLMVQEPIEKGQRISAFYVEAFVEGDWKVIAHETTIGFKRLLRFDPVTSDRVRLTFSSWNNTPAISNTGIYKASGKE